MDPMFDIPGSDIVDVIIDQDTVRHQAPARYVTRPDDSPHEEDESASGSGAIPEQQEVSASR